MVRRDPGDADGGGAHLAPEGLNLYVIQAFRKPGEEGTRGTIMDVYVGVMPFFALMMLGIALVIAFPQLAVWLPNTMRGK